MVPMAILSLDTDYTVCTEDCDEHVDKCQPVGLGLREGY